ncbi:LLM class flavin-dependent oxidoreductase [Serratia entomophila]|uniref:LLM class flavin-dependent oxidoreductase n=1 Tax=Serratia entomophila TaxID=42906 RepID=A0ABY5CKJ7_9GAMM|nr:LLM class flavin-dependent oxidoreductase [Serratia entomophila]USU98812.1 LLM class flavin-dependent oxidoreductase [Serratia entomophila]CAI0809604.1 Nitrilotriacetate monooxygenase component A [Serratia entomophila]CAI0815022.1 Nitrilotriacetate monooxygenase component A [Serratia entomophila]CAI0834475.1 Nitrilotriacetate monooxygenase component A [Serratia entomophila]CAI0872607.1 Nitrilotriacetate monooxygenase component A [Serratia entomophila]
MSRAAKEILLNAFNMNCVGHIHHGMWTHPQDRSTEFNQLSYWTELAQLLERGLFDGLFIADILGVYDVYQQNIALTASESIQLPVNDPLMLVSAMAAVTRHLGFGVTANLSYEAPYPFARRLSTLDHLTQGRIGWNIVTGYLDSAARAMGLTQQVSHDRRYDQADEFLEVAYQLWEGSWQDDAVLADRQRRVYADAQKIHQVKHQGEFYQVEGYHLSSPSPQRTPLLFQAGSSARGIQFAARHAECTFVNGATPAAMKAQVDKLRAAAQAAGRRRQDLKVFMGLGVIVAPTAAEAQDKYREYLRYASPEAGIAHFSSSTGIDLSRFGLDDPIQAGPTQAIESVTKTYSGWTRRQLLEQHAMGGRYPLVVGDPSQVADALLQWIDQADIDGFNLTRILNPGSYRDFIELVVPELQSRGRYKTAYRSGTLRQKLFQQQDRLPASHPAASWRPHSPLSA